MAHAQYVSQGIATKAFGVTFRSKLEAQWAYYLTENKLPWDYADSEWHDFLLEGCCHLEVKPRGLDFLLDALERAWPHKDAWHDKTMLFVLGEPESSVWCVVQVLDCSDCASLSLSGKDNAGNHLSIVFAWNSREGVYGHWCEHGVFHPEKEIGHCNQPLSPGPS